VPSHDAPLIQSSSSRHSTRKISEIWARPEMAFVVMEGLICFRDLLLDRGVWGAVKTSHPSIVRLLHVSGPRHIFLQAWKDPTLRRPRHEDSSSYNVADGLRIVAQGIKMACSLALPITHKLMTRTAFAARILVTPDLGFCLSGQTKLRLRGGEGRRAGMLSLLLIEQQLLELLLTGEVRLRVSPPLTIMQTRDCRTLGALWTPVRQTFRPCWIHTWHCFT